MDVPRIGPHMFANGSQEGDDVVLHDLLEGVDPPDVEVRLLLDVGERLRRYQPELGIRLARKEFHLKPCAVSVFRFPEARHFGPAVTRDHAVLLLSPTKHFCLWCHTCESRYPLAFSKTNFKLDSRFRGND